MTDDPLGLLWKEIQSFLATDPKPNDYRKLSVGEIRHSMSMPRYFLDHPLRFDSPTMELVRKMVERHRLNLDIREEPDGGPEGNIVINGPEGNYYGRITTKGLTLTPQRFGEEFFRDVMRLYLKGSA